jgi:hypothetical protein
MKDAVKNYKFSAKPAERKMNAKQPEKKAVESNTRPDPSQYKGKIMNDKLDGKRYKSDGKKWNEIT